MSNHIKLIKQLRLCYIKFQIWHTKLMIKIGFDDRNGKKIQNANSITPILIIKKYYWDLIKFCSFCQTQ